MANTKVSIANSALLKLGASPIYSFDDDTKEARLVKLRFDLVKAGVLRKHPWNCATKRTTLAALVGQPSFGWSYQFQLPTDFLRVTRISVVDYTIEGTLLLADDATIELKYIFMQEEEKLDPLCAECIAFQLASELCYAITQSKTLKEQIDNDMKKAYSGAKTVDATDEPPGSWEADEFLDARTSSSLPDTRMPMRDY